MKTAVLVSGGVDSSVALHLLARRRQASLRAYYLKIWLEDELSYLGACPWEEDLSYARAVCDAAGVPLEVVPLQLDYYERVVGYVVDELRAGRTPSPDVYCNSRIKFGAFLDYLGDGFDAVASGHYARVAERDGAIRLLRSPDLVKDQTYFLARLSQNQIARASFPIGGLLKARVRALAAEFGLPNRDRKDSQGICFLGKLRYPDFVRHYLGEKEGPIVDADSGTVLGAHRGYWFHTIGQRSGLGLGNGPWYVVAKDVGGNAVYVSRDRGDDGSGGAPRSEFPVGDLNWIAGPPTRREGLFAKLRHGPALVPCAIRFEDPPGAPAAGAGTRQATVTLEREDRGVAPGQIAVLYDGETCLGSGIILSDAPRAGRSAA